MDLKLQVEGDTKETKVQVVEEAKESKVQVEKKQVKEDY